MVVNQLKVHPLSKLWFQLSTCTPYIEVLGVLSHLSRDYDEAVAAFNGALKVRVVQAAPSLKPDLVILKARLVSNFDWSKGITVLST